MLRSRLCFTAVAIVSMVAISTGCMSSGNKIAAADVSEIKKGVTTRAEVEQKLGPPAFSGIYPEGKRMLQYNYYESTSDGRYMIPVVGLFSGSGTQKQQMLQIIIDKNGIVEDVEFSDTNSRSEGGYLNTKRTVEPAPK